MKKIIFSILFIFSFLCIFSVNNYAYSWDLKPINEVQLDYGFNVSPTGKNNGFLYDCNVYMKENQTAYGFYMALSTDYYYDFYIFAMQDQQVVYEIEDDESNTTNYTFYTTRKTLKSIINTSYNFDLINYDENNPTNLTNAWHFYGMLNPDNQSETFLNFRYPNLLNLNNYHIYIYIEQSNYNRINNYIYNNLDNDDFSNYYRNNIIDSYCNDMFETIQIEFNNYSNMDYVLMTQTYIFDYETPYTSFIANGVRYYDKFLFDMDYLSNYDTYMYGYGFFQSCFSLNDLYLSGSIYDIDNEAIYPTYSQNMLYYVIPYEFPNYTFTQGLPYNSCELLYSFDYRRLYSDYIEQDLDTGLAKTYTSLNYSDYIQNNFYSFGFSRCILYKIDANNNEDWSYFFPINMAQTSTVPFIKINAQAFYVSDIYNGTSLDNSTNNDDLANALGLHYNSCKWWDLKGQLQNLFYYLITGLPFLNNLYKFLNQIFGISKIGFNLISFSVPLLSLVSFVLLVYIVFNKLLK